LNPGYITPSAFYNTHDIAQSKYSWGPHGYQYGPTFNQTEYNQSAAPNTPWGLQQLAQPLTSQQLQDLLSGRGYTPPTIAPATRMNPYIADNRIPSSYGQLQLSPTYKGTYTPPTPIAPVAPVIPPDDYSYGYNM
jgi:hypothetical protein